VGLFESSFAQIDHFGAACSHNVIIDYVVAAFYALPAFTVADASSRISPTEDREASTAHAWFR
jgi:hypothetical protein